MKRGRGGGLGVCECRPRASPSFPRLVGGAELTGAHRPLSVTHDGMFRLDVDDTLLLLMSRVHVVLGVVLRHVRTGWFGPRRSGRESSYISRGSAFSPHYFPIHLRIVFPPPRAGDLGVSVPALTRK